MDFSSSLSPHPCVSFALVVLRPLLVSPRQVEQLLRRLLPLRTHAVHQRAGPTVLFGREQRDGRAALACAARTADAVRVLLGGAGGLEAHNVVQLAHMQTARGHVSRHEDGQAALLKRLQRLHAARLQQVAVQQPDLAAAELLGQGQSTRHGLAAGDGATEEKDGTVLLH